MQKYIAISALMLGLSVGAASYAHQGATGIVKERMDKFSQSQRDLKASFKLAKSGEFADIMTKARAMVAWGREMPSFFPEGSGGAPSEASPQIWQDMAGFTAASTAFALAAEDVIMAAEKGDIDSTISALRSVGQTCGTCHRTYRVK